MRTRAFAPPLSFRDALLEVAAMPREQVLELLERLIVVGALGLASPADEPTHRVTQPPAPAS